MKRATEEWDDLIAQIDLAGCDDPAVLAAAERDLQAGEASPPPAVMAPLRRPWWRRWQWVAATLALAGSLLFVSSDANRMLWRSRSHIEKLAYDPAIELMLRDWGEPEHRNSAASKVSWNAIRALKSLQALFAGKDVPEPLRQDCAEAAEALAQQLKRGHADIEGMEECFLALVSVVVDADADPGERRVYLRRLFASLSSGVAALQAMPRNAPILVEQIPLKLDAVRRELDKLRTRLTAK